VLKEIRDELREDSHLVIISGGLEIASVEEAFKGAVTKIIPTLLAEVREGITLVCHNSRVPAGAAERLEAMLAVIGEVKAIPERSFEIASDFTSCAPGLISAICDQLVRAGARRGDFSYEEAEAMLIGSMAGTAKLLRKNREGFRELISRVATAGGATEGGASELERTLPEAFDRMFTAIEARHEARKEATRRQFIPGRTS
jgi:pyrroline-5-carboxylate reductase